MVRTVEIVVNPASGSKKLALSLVEKHVKPLLASVVSPSSSSPSSSSSIRTWETKCEGDGVRIGREIIAVRQKEKEVEEEQGIDIVLVGGDGTTHEVLNGLYLPSDDDDGGMGREVEVRFAIVPGGTANALYSAMYPQEWSQEVQHQAATAESVEGLDSNVIDVMLKSVHALVSSSSSESPPLHEEEVKQQHLNILPLMLNTLFINNDNGNHQKQLVSHLVTSHALHAAILHDADTPEMRSQHAGIERFKVAAQQNATRWTSGTLILHPLSSSPSSFASKEQVGEGEQAGILRYSPTSKRFEPFHSVEIEGPFLYLNAMLTDRLESAFIPAPLSSAFTATTADGTRVAGRGLPKDAVDLVVIRPTRDPALAKVEDGGLKFAMTRLGEITTGMYSGGKHIDLVYTNKDSTQSGGGGDDDEQPMVEYFRCSGYTFTPSKDFGEQGEGGKARLVCTDGFISSADEVSVERWIGGRSRKSRVAAPLVWR